MLEQVVILVGGKGTRLGSLTNTTPKPLLEVAGRPFLEHILQELSRFGFKRATLLAGNLGQQFHDAYHGRVLNGLTIDVVVEPYPLGTGGALRFAADKGCLEESFLLTNGDSWIDADLTAFNLRWLRARNDEENIQALVLLHHVEDTSRYGTVETRDGLVTSFIEKKVGTESSRGGQINAGVYVLDRGVAELLVPGQPASLETDLLPDLAAAGRVAGISAPSGTYFVDIGLPETLESSREDMLRHRTRPALFLDRDGTLNVDAGYTHRPADLEWQPDARDTIKLANEAGYFVFVVTNQAGVAHGLYDETAVISFHEAMQAQLFELGAHVDAFSYCPHHEHAKLERYRRSCRRRKPAPGMMEDLAASWPIDMSRSLLVGNTDTDLRAGSAAGLKVLKYEGDSLLALVKPNLSVRD